MLYFFWKWRANQQTNKPVLYVSWKWSTNKKTNKQIECCTFLGSEVITNKQIKCCRFLGSEALTPLRNKQIRCCTFLGNELLSNKQIECCSTFLGSEVLTMVLRLDFRKFNDLHCKILWDFSFDWNHFNSLDIFWQE